MAVAARNLHSQETDFSLFQSCNAFKSGPLTENTDWSSWRGDELAEM